MRDVSPWHLPLFISMAIVASATIAPTPASAIGGFCGGVVRCECGDVVTSSRTLVPGDDPITSTTCPGTGLIIVNDDVTLDLGGATLRGSDVGVGVDIQGANRTTVQNGRVVHFRRGIRGTDVSNTTITDVQALENAGAGMTLQDDPAVLGSVTHVDACIVRNNGGDGLVVQGSNVTVSFCRIESNGGTGLIVDGTNNDLLRNIVYRSGGDGIHVKGDGATADRNQSKYNHGEGFVVEGANHTLTLNFSNSNDTDGFTVTAVDSLFERNTASYNGRAAGGQPPDGYGIRDSTTGDGTKGTDNTYVNNRCTGNGLGASLPPGLCS
jgi:hypothetical protein